MKRFIYSIHILLLCSICCNAQIGYQVSLLNSATGEPRANETVSVQVQITNSENTVICSETKSATTNEFGVLSLQIGSASTFQNVDWSKLPLFVSATVDGIMVGKSQILNVPVAEAAKTLVNIDPVLICKTWSCSQHLYGNYYNNYSVALSTDNTFTFCLNGTSCVSGFYYTQGKLIIFCYTTSIEDIFDVLPFCLLYDNNRLSGLFGAAGYMILQ